MLTNYESYLYDALTKCQEELKKAKEELGYSESSLKRKTEEAERNADLWRDSYTRCHDLEKQIEEMKKEKEQDVATSNSFDNLKEAV